MATERTPEELETDDRRHREVRAALDDITQIIASWIVADELDEPADVCEQWVDRMWDTTRERLTPELRIRAVLTLLENDARKLADRTLADLRYVEEA